MTIGPGLARRIAAWALVLGGAASASAAPAKPVVMVIYFDNLTGKPEHDVMKKGLADMIITDLIAYDGVTVVERDKLEAVMAELHLQAARAFDPATRARLGKLVGARYLISGSMLGVTPEVRIDARLTEVATGVDLTAVSVRGAPDRLFDLEQELVAKLTSSIDAKLVNDIAARKMKGVDVATVLAYARGLDLEDRGKLDEARKQYSAALKTRPSFALPRDRTAKLLSKLTEQEATRTTALSNAAQSLATAAERALTGGFDQLTREQQGEYLAFRMVRGRLLGRALKQQVVARSYPSVVVKGHEAAALRLLREIRTNYDHARDELARYHQQRGQTSSPDLRLPSDLDRMAQEAHLTSGSESLSDGGLLRQSAEFVLLGKVYDGDQQFTIAPALGDLDPTLGAATLAALDRAVDALGRTARAGAEYEVSAALELEADALFRIGRTEDGIARLQRFLDDYPTSTRFSSIARRINLELGVEFSSNQDDLLKYPDKGLKQCDYFALYRGAGAIVTRRVAVKGVTGLVETIREIERACAGRPLFWNNLYSLFAGMAFHFGECELSRALWHKYLAHNGSRSDLEGYQRSQPDCAILP
jgi:TolB-like protein